MIYKVTLNNKIFEVEVEKGEAVILAEYEAALPNVQSTAVVAPAQKAVAAVPAASAFATGRIMKSPLPGNIMEVKGSEGQQVKAGDVLVILEAMKMENEIAAPWDGKIGKIFVAKGATIQTGAPLIEIL